MIEFNYNIENFKLNNEKAIEVWLEQLIEKHDKELGDLCFCFVDDEELLDMNNKYLKHNTYTDVISFDYCQDYLVNGEVFISAQRVKENAKDFNIKEEEEFLRVLSHSVLHLLGYNDHSEEDIQRMRQAEKQAIELFEILK